MVLDTKIFGWIASILSIMMYAANFDQARLNLMGYKGSLLLPLCGVFAALFRCMFARWNPRNPITGSNSVGIVASLASIVTYFM